MSTAADTHALEPAETPLTPESWGKLGMWNFLAADAMTFGGFLAAYGALRYGDPHWPDPSTILGIPLTAFMTFLLICSSVTMVESLAGMRQGNQAKCARFLALTFQPFIDHLIGAGLVISAPRGARGGGVGLSDGRGLRASRAVVRFAAFGVNQRVVGLVDLGESGRG